MKKKMLAVLLAGAMVASLTACGGSNSADTADTTKTEESGDGAEAADTKDASEFKVGLITDVGGVNDGSFNQREQARSLVLPLTIWSPLRTLTMLRTWRLLLTRIMI